MEAISAGCMEVVILIRILWAVWTATATFLERETAILHGLTSVVNFGRNTTEAIQSLFIASEDDW